MMLGTTNIKFIDGFSRQHDTEQDSDYQQLQNDRTIYY